MHITCMVDGMVRCLPLETKQHPGDREAYYKWPRSRSPESALPELSRYNVHHACCHVRFMLAIAVCGETPGGVLTSKPDTGRRPGRRKPMLNRTRRKSRSWG